MRRRPVRKTAKSFTGTLKRVVSGERVVIKREGQAVAAVVPIEDLALLEKLEDRLDKDEAERILSETKEEDWVPWEQVKKELSLK